MNRFIIFIGLFLFANDTFSQHQILEKEIHSIIKDKNATVGVAAIFDGKDTVVINNQYYYPTLSVYKFHLALAVLDYLDKNKIPLNTQLFIDKTDLKHNTYSPLRDERPEGNYHMTLSDLLKYTVSKSDNNGCDILFNYIGGTKVVDKYIKSLGIKDIGIRATENEMHEKMENQYLNWTNPLAMVQLLEIFLNKELFAKEYKDFLLQTMIETTTGSNKIKALLPKNLIVGHKTGSSFRNSYGLNIAENDAGFIELPNGKRYTLAVFVMNSMEDDKTNTAIIAEISKVVYDYYKEK